MIIINESIFLIDSQGVYQTFSGGLLIADLFHQSPIQTSPLGMYALLNTELKTDCQINGFHLLATSSGVIRISVFDFDTLK